VAAVQGQLATVAARPLDVCVMGLWHLGSVTAACLAGAGHRVVGTDDDATCVAGLRDGRAPVAEPGLDALIAAGIAAGRLRFTTDAAEAVAGADVVWVTYDTPVDDDDAADVAFVVERVRAILPRLAQGSVLLLSSQLPVGTASGLAGELEGRGVIVAASPENLRLGKAIEAFTQAERIVVGVDPEAPRDVLTALLEPFAERLLWMSVRSAEMTKHAINAYLATSVAFANELARLCEVTGATASEVETGLRSEPRIGPRAYIRPGAAFAGGTLARDVVFLEALGEQAGRATPVLDGVRASNAAHQEWPDLALERLIGPPSGREIAVWGLTYKVGTSTLRRSSALELCRRLASKGASVRAYDPAVPQLPADDGAAVQLASDPLGAARGADAVVVMTPWPVFGEVDSGELVAALRQPVVVDPDASFARTLDVSGVRYASVGRVPA
jgi:UDPglucose 6-dehydrogenase